MVSSQILSPCQSVSGTLPGTLGREWGRSSFSGSNSPNSLCLSIGTWTIEASYQTAPKQKFKIGFEVKEYGEKGCWGGQGGSLQGVELERQSRSHGACSMCQGLPELGAGGQDHASSPPGLPESPRKEQVGQGRDRSGVGTVRR